MNTKQITNKITQKIKPIQAFNHYSLLIIVLSLFDIITTFIGVGILNATEINPIASTAIHDHGWTTFITGKLGLTLIALFILYLERNQKFTKKKDTTKSSSILNFTIMIILLLVVLSNITALTIGALIAQEYTITTLSTLTIITLLTLVIKSTQKINHKLT